MAFIKSLDYIDIKGVRISFSAEFTGTEVTLLFLQELTTELFFYYYYFLKKQKKGRRKRKKKKN